LARAAGERSADALRRGARDPGRANLGRRPRGLRERRTHDAYAGPRRDCRLGPGIDHRAGAPARPARQQRRSWLGPGRAAGLGQHDVRARDEGRRRDAGSTAGARAVAWEALVARGARLAAGWREWLHLARVTNRSHSARGPALRPIARFTAGASANLDEGARGRAPPAKGGTARTDRPTTLSGALGSGRRADDRWPDGGDRMALGPCARGRGRPPFRGQDGDSSHPSLGR